VSPLGAILRYGAHVPRLRLARSVITEAMAWANPPGRSRSQGARAIGNWDEDALTMGVQAARSCLAPPDGGVAEDLVPRRFGQRGGQSAIHQGRRGSGRSVAKRGG